MKGHRVLVDPPRAPLLRAGDYYKTPTGDYWAVLPSGPFVRLSDHKIYEHADGSISVEPDIYLEGRWHGYLIRGEWIEYGKG